MVSQAWRIAELLKGIYVEATSQEADTKSIAEGQGIPAGDTNEVKFLDSECLMTYTQSNCAVNVVFTVK